jgi:hypothetical protein
MNETFLIIFQDSKANWNRLEKFNKNNSNAILVIETVKYPESKEVVVKLECKFETFVELTKVLVKIVLTKKDFDRIDKFEGNDKWFFVKFEV